MASNRHLGRIIVLQSLYEVVFRQDSSDDNANLNEIIERNISRYKAAGNDSDFIYDLAKNIVEKKPELDSRIQPLAPDWPLEQIAKIDYIVLQIGAYELIYNADEVPPKVVINEAVELAKAFGGENSSKFINGVLGSLLKEINPELSEPDTSPKKELNEETK